MQTIFKINNLSITDQDNNIILSNINLKLKEKEIILLTGANGVGKSTLLKAIFKHPDYKISSGNIIVNIHNVDRDITNMPAYEMARLGIFLSPQDIPDIESISVIKMLYNANKNINNDSKIDIVEFRNNLITIADYFKIDNSLLDRNLNDKFSGGEKKQSALLYILAIRPHIIFLDEPDSGVDKDSLSKIYKIIKYLRDNGATILIISHNIDLKNIVISKKYIITNKNNVRTIKEYKDVNVKNNKDIINDISSDDMMN
ncbi:MAG: ATP-binding cassette domain-containing protein [Cyanobium sp. MAG06]|nr:ATP-binding cassette domain-containing protein [Cyanobium sp. MAG06]